MADEVIITEFKRPDVGQQGGVAPVYGEVVTSQVLDIGTLSAAVSADAVMVRLQSKGTGFWYKQGDSDVSAAADTDGSSWLPADQSIDLSVRGAVRYIDTAADA